jgi:hypothetical protein
MSACHPCRDSESFRDVSHLFKITTIELVRRSSKELRTAFARTVNIEQKPENGGLSCTVGSEKRNYLSGVDREVEVVDCYHPSEPFGEVSSCDDRTTGFHGVILRGISTPVKTIRKNFDLNRKYPEPCRE